MGLPRSRFRGDAGPLRRSVTWRRRGRSGAQSPVRRKLLGRPLSSASFESPEHGGDQRYRALPPAGCEPPAVGGGAAGLGWRFPGVASAGERARRGGVTGEAVPASHPVPSAPALYRCSSRGPVLQRSHRADVPHAGLRPGILRVSGPAAFPKLPPFYMG